MPTANDAIALIERLQTPLGLEWVNTGRVSKNWKTKIFEHRGSGLQFAIYNRESILVLLEREVAPIPGVTLRPKRAEGDSLKIAASHFREQYGYCYEVDEVESLSKLLVAYLERRS